MAPGDLVAAPFDQDMLRTGIVPVALAEYGWEWFRYYRASNKLSYLFTQVTQGQLPDGLDDQGLTEHLLADNERLAMLAKVVKEHAGCALRFIQGGGYVDHDSAGVGMELFQDEEMLKNFLFNPNVCVQTGNDNDTIPFVIGTDRGEEYVYPRLTVREDLDIGAPAYLALRVVDHSAGALVTPKGAYLSAEEFNPELFAALRQHAIAAGGTRLEVRPYQGSNDRYDQAQALPQLAQALAKLNLRMHAMMQVDFESKVIAKGYENVLTARFYMPEALAKEIAALAPTPPVMVELASLLRRHAHFARQVQEGGDSAGDWAQKLEKETSQEIDKLCDQAAKEGVLF